MTTAAWTSVPRRWDGNKNTSKDSAGSIRNALPALDSFMETTTSKSLTFSSDKKRLCFFNDTSRETSVHAVSSLHPGAQTGGRLFTTLAPLTYRIKTWNTLGSIGIVNGLRSCWAYFFYQQSGSGVDQTTPLPQPQP